MYLQEALSALSGESVTMQLQDENAACLMEEDSYDARVTCKYVVMPMRI